MSINKRNYYNILKLAAWNDVNPFSQAYFGYGSLSEPSRAEMRNAYDNFDPKGNIPITASKETKGVNYGGRLQEGLENIIKNLQNPAKSKNIKNIQDEVQSYINDPLNYKPGSIGVTKSPINAEMANNLLNDVKATRLNLMNSQGFNDAVNNDRLFRSTQWIMSEPFRESNPELHNVVNNIRTKLVPGNRSNYNLKENGICLTRNVSPAVATHEGGHPIAIHKDRYDPSYKNLLYYNRGMVAAPDKLYYSGAMNRRAALSTLITEAEANNTSWKLLKQQLKNEPQLLRQLAISRTLELPGYYTTYVSSALPALSGLIVKPTRKNSMLISDLKEMSVPMADLLIDSPISSAGMLSANIGTRANKLLFPNLNKDLINYAKSIGMPEYWSSENKINELRKSLQKPLRKEEISTKGPVTVQKPNNKVSPMSKRLLKGSLNKR